MSLQDFNSVILDYLVTSGNEAQALLFFQQIGSPENGVPPSFDLERITAIARIKDAILKHNFQLAWQLVLDLDPPAMTAHPEIEVCFALAQIVEGIVYQEPQLNIIISARETVVPLIARLTDQQERILYEQMLEHLISLLVVPQSNPPVKQLLDPRELEQWCFSYLHNWLQQTDVKPKFAQLVELYGVLGE